MNWTNAGLSCRSLHRDAHLLVINDVHEQAAIVEMLASTSGRFFSRPYLSYGRAIGKVVVRPSVTDVLWLSFRSQGRTFCRNN